MPSYHNDPQGNMEERIIRFLQTWTEEKIERVLASCIARDCVACRRAMLCTETGPFGVIHHTKDLLDASGWPPISAACYARVEE